MEFEPKMTFYNFVPKLFLSAREGSVERATRGDDNDNAPRVVYNRSASANCRLNVPVLHDSRSFSKPGICKTGGYFRILKGWRGTWRESHLGTRVKID